MFGNYSRNKRFLFISSFFNNYSSIYYDSKSIFFASDLMEVNQIRDPFAKSVSNKNLLCNKSYISAKIKLLINIVKNKKKFLENKPILRSLAYFINLVINNKINKIIYKQALIRAIIKWDSKTFTKTYINNYDLSI